jgi:hypothetical protein
LVNEAHQTLACVMNLIGSRPTLLTNLCALAVASVVSAEGAYIVHECFGYYRPQDIWGFFTPALVMFIVRNSKFSYGFLALYVASAVQMLHQARSIHVDPYACGGRIEDPLGLLAPLFFVSAISLTIYAGQPSAHCKI